MKGAKGIAGVLASAALLTGSLLASCVNLDGYAGGPGSDDGAAPMTDGAGVGSDGTGTASDSGSTTHDATSGADGGTTAADGGGGSIDSGGSSLDAQPDTSSPHDASAPDTSAPDSSTTTPFCTSLAPAPTFCSDFDEGAFDDGWSSSQATNGSIGLDTTAFESPPASLVASSGTTSNTVQAAVFRQFGATGSSYHYAFDLRVDQVASGAEPIFAEVQLMTGNTLEYGITFIVESTGAIIEESYTNGGVQFVDTALSAAPPTGTWTRVTMDLLGPGTGAGTVTVTLGSTVVLNGHRMPNGAANGVPVISAGLEIFPGQQITACKGHIDNLTFQITP